MFSYRCHSHFLLHLPDCSGFCSPAHGAFCHKQHPSRQWHLRFLPRTIREFLYRPMGFTSFPFGPHPGSTKFIHESHKNQKELQNLRRGFGRVRCSRTVCRVCIITAMTKRKGRQHGVCPCVYLSLTALLFTCPAGSWSEQRCCQHTDRRPSAERRQDRSDRTRR